MHHTRKSGGQGIEKVLGGTGLLGAVDTIISISRNLGDTRGVVEVTGRDVEDAAYGFEFANLTWTFAGKPDEEEGQKKVVLDWLADHPDAVVGPTAISKETGIPVGTTGYLLSMLARESRVSKLGYGKYQHKKEG